MKLYLQQWRGVSEKSASTRRYNSERFEYVIRPWYVNKVLYSAMWQRAIHSGESVSRMLDFAVRNYLPRLLEDLLRIPMPGCHRAVRNAPFWTKRYDNRKHKSPEGFINYSCKTTENQKTNICYVQQSTFFPKSNLEPAEILHLTRYAA